MNDRCLTPAPVVDLLIHPTALSPRATQVAECDMRSLEGGLHGLEDLVGQHQHRKDANVPMSFSQRGNEALINLSGHDQQPRGSR